MMQATNLIVAPSFAVMNGAPQVSATPVDICDVCGGLFVRQGVLFMGMPHSH